VASEEAEDRVVDGAGVLLVRRVRSARDLDALGVRQQLLGRGRFAPSDRPSRNFATHVGFGESSVCRVQRDREIELRRLATVLGVGLAILNVAGCAPVGAPGATGKIEYVGTEVVDGYSYDLYRNLAYPCSISGYRRS
jgi:hypothetical protein